MRRRGRRELLLLGLGGIVLLALGAWVCRRPLLESWWLHRLERGGRSEKLEAVERLGDVGAERAVRALLEVLRAGTEKLAEAPGEVTDEELVEEARSEPWSPEGMELLERACCALEEIAPRVGPDLRVAIVEGVLATARAVLWIGKNAYSAEALRAEIAGFGETAFWDRLTALLARLDATLGKVGSEHPETYPALIGAILWVEEWFDASEERWPTPADTLRAAWPRSREALADALSRAGGSSAARLYPWLSPRSREL